MADLVEALTARLGPEAVLHDAADCERFVVDFRRRYRGRARCVVLPSNVEQVAEIVRLCRETGTPVVPQGGNTGMSGGAIPPMDGQSVVIGLERMARIRDLDSQGNTLTAEAGVTLAAIQAAAAGADRLFPLSLGSEGSCQIGGNIATNAGGTAVLRYGNMRELVLGIEAVLPDGRIWNGLRALRKDNSGYDLKQLLIGAEGTLGIVTAAVLKLFPRPRGRTVAWVGTSGLDRALDLLALLREHCGDRLSAFEILSHGQLELLERHVPGCRNPLDEAHSWNILVELSDTVLSDSLRLLVEETLAAVAERGLLDDAVIATNERQAAELWHLRHSVTEANMAEGFSLSHDTSVPIGLVPDFVRRATDGLARHHPQARTVAVGHLGDGNIHLVVIFPRDMAATPEQREALAAGANRIVHDIAAGLNGSISAEHGIGVSRRLDLKRYRSPVELDLMAALKRAWDPDGLMNPGKVI